MRAILTYHSIDPSGSPISCHPDVFDRHVAWLASGRTRVTTIPELLALPASEDAVAITFDDAFANFEEFAAPRLRRHGLPVTLFVVADRVGATNAWGGAPENGIPHLPLLDWSSLARLHENGVTVGAHTRTHCDLTRLPADAVERELRGSADAIQQRIGDRPSVFAYPYGRFDAQSARIASTVYSYSCTTELRVIDAHAAPAALPRLDMYYFQQPGYLESWGSRRFTRYVALRRGLRRLRRTAAAAARMLPSS
jgi:peptidoglycan/xylan/chitin deacetylase (PgdA/CDA1 family)